MEPLPLCLQPSGATHHLARVSDSLTPELRKSLLNFATLLSEFKVGMASVGVVQQSCQAL